MAVFRSSGPEAAADALAGGPVPAGWGSPTTSCSPSISLRAKDIPSIDVAGSTPPAAAMASATRAPAASFTSPGRRTFPATSTTTSGNALETAPPG